MLNIKNLMLMKGLCIKIDKGNFSKTFFKRIIDNIPFANISNQSSIANDPNKINNNEYVNSKENLTKNKLFRTNNYEMTLTGDEIYRKSSTLAQSPVPLIDKERIYKIYNEGITRVITQEYTSDNKIIDEAYYDKTTVNLLNLHYV